MNQGAIAFTIFLGGWIIFMIIGFKKKLSVIISVGGSFIAALVLLFITLPLWNTEADATTSIGIIVIAVIGYALFAVANVAEKARKERAQKAQRDRERIYEKYGRTEIAENILNKILWVGETTEQLIDSLGSPQDTDEKVLKTKKKETWKYYHKGANRYGLRITIENNVIVGWDEKL